ncbi:MAG: serine/threonine protein kinase [Deltaproteobacteria bacterium]|nr:MAG: serine/threonine protein kinase [Deltaproteobacteria bacterium]
MFEQYPKEFGPYMLLQKIGQGGMAEIFRAESAGPQGFAKEVAIKRILSSLASNEDFITQFLDEARIVGNLSHPNIVQIYDVGQVDDAYYIAMEFVDGKHMGQVIQRSIESMSQVPVREATAIINEVSKALAFAHSAVDSLGNPLHIIHRDVSPQNILIGFNGAIKLTDFGIAKAANKLFQTTAGVIKGKFSYLAPEQLVGKGASTASDIFSLGVAFWEMLSGRRLFQGESDIRTIQLVQACQVPPLSQFRNDVPPELEQVITYMLSPSPEYRYQNAYDLVNALSHILHHFGVSEHLNLVANFMGSLYPENYQNSGAAPTRASMPAVSEAEAAQYYPSVPSGPASVDDFGDDPTQALSESPLADLTTQLDPNETTSQGTLPSNDPPTMPLDSKEVADFFATQQMPPGALNLPSAAATPASATGALDIPSAVSPSMDLPPGILPPTKTPPPPLYIPSVGIGEPPAQKPTAPLPVEQALPPAPQFHGPSVPTAAPAPMTPNSAPTAPNQQLKKSPWKALILTSLFLGLLGGGVAFGFIYYQQRQDPIGMAPPTSRPTTLQVLVHPPEARVTINGQPLTGSSKRQQSGLISGLKYSLRASLKGYKTYNHRFELQDGQTLSLKVTLQQESSNKDNDED